MTNEQKISYVKAILGNDERYDSSLINAFLLDAKSAVLRRLYPFGIPDNVTDVPELYEVLQCKLCLRYLQRIGAEGEVLHAENGTDRHYGSVNEEDLLMEITPYIKLAKVGDS